MEELIKNKYIEKKRLIKKEFRGKQIEYFEVYYLDILTNDEVYFKSTENENKLRCIDSYKREMKLLTSSQIKQIREKYDLTQREYAFILGLGEITVHRYEKGAIQSSGDNQLMLFSCQPKLFMNMLNNNHSCLTTQRYIEIKKNVQKMMDKDLQQIVTDDQLFKIDGKLIKPQFNDLCSYVVKKYKKRFPIEEKLSLNKLTLLLFYLQGLSLVRFNDSIFNEKMYLSNKTIVIDNVNYDGLNTDAIYLSEGLHQLINLTVEQFGKFVTSYLNDLTLKLLDDNSKKKQLTNSMVKEVFSKIYLNS